MTRPVTNPAASARARLLESTRRRKGDFQLTLQRYAIERFLFRLGSSVHRERFVLKGATLFVLWSDETVRPTRDLDLAGYWANDADSLAAAFRDICSVPCPADGIEFLLSTMEVDPIRDAARYHGFRIRMNARLAGAVIPLQVDVGFGDAIVPAAVDVRFPVLLGGDQPSIRAYRREVTVAEKLHAMVYLAELNSRYKDFFDVYVLASRFSFEGLVLSAAVAATFARRDSASLSPWPIALTPGFFEAASRRQHWARFVQRSGLSSAPSDFGPVGESVLAFLAPVVQALSTDSPFDRTWAPNGPWS